MEACKHFFFFHLLLALLLLDSAFLGMTSQVLVPEMDVNGARQNLTDYEGSAGPGFSLVCTPFLCPALHAHDARAVQSRLWLPELMQTGWTRLGMMRVNHFLCKLVPGFHKNTKKVPQSTAACESLPTTHLPSEAGKYGEPKNRDEESLRKHMADGTRSLTIGCSVSALTG